MLYDKCSIHSFPDNDVIIPLIALDELDRFKIEMADHLGLELPSYLKGLK